MQSLVKFFEAYMSYLIGEIRIYSLQEAAQFDIEKYNIESENLFYFAHILEINYDERAAFEKYLGNIIDEFDLPTAYDYMLAMKLDIVIVKL